MAEETGGLGTPGRPVNRRSPFMIGMTGALGVAVAYGLVELISADTTAAKATPVTTPACTENPACIALVQHGRSARGWVCYK